MKKLAILLMAGVFFQGCALHPNAPSQQLGEGYYSDLEYNPADGRYYHKTPPPDASSTQYVPPRTYQDLE